VAPLTNRFAMTRQVVGGGGKAFCV
jgi:hypothetical protein